MEMALQASQHISSGLPRLEEELNKIQTHIDNKKTPPNSSLDEEDIKVSLISNILSGDFLNYCYCALSG